jgi:hypothetical protein
MEKASPGSISRYWCTNGKYSGSLVNSPDLILNDVNLNDETNYTCTATNDVGTGQSISRSLDSVLDLQIFYME